jgi:hypothetical protein
LTPSIVRGVTFLIPIRRTLPSLGSLGTLNVLRMSQVSCGEFGVGAPTIHRGFEVVEGVAQRRDGRGGAREDVGEPRAQHAGVDAREEEGGPEPGGGDLVAVRSVDPGDEPVEPQAAELVGQAARGQCVRHDTQQAREQRAQVAIGEALGEQPEDHKRAEQCLDARVSEAERRHPLPVDHLRSGHRAEGVRADRAVVREPFDLEQPAVGVKADLPQRGEIREPLADPDVPGIVDRGLGAQRAALRVVLLDARSFVVDVAGRG